MSFEHNNNLANGIVKLLNYVTVGWPRDNPAGHSVSGGRQEEGRVSGGEVGDTSSWRVTTGDLRGSTGCTSTDIR